MVPTSRNIQYIDIIISSNSILEGAQYHHASGHASRNWQETENID